MGLCPPQLVLCNSLEEVSYCSQNKIIRASFVNRRRQGPESMPAILLSSTLLTVPLIFHQKLVQLLCNKTQLTWQALTFSSKTNSWRVVQVVIVRMPCLSLIISKLAQGSLTKISPQLWTLPTSHPSNRLLWLLLAPDETSSKTPTWSLGVSACNRGQTSISLKAISPLTFLGNMVFLRTYPCNYSSKTTSYFNSNNSKWWSSIRVSITLIWKMLDKGMCWWKKEKRRRVVVQWHTVSYARPWILNPLCLQIQLFKWWMVAQVANTSISSTNSKWCNLGSSNSNNSRFPNHKYHNTRRTLSDRAEYLFRASPSSPVCTRWCNLR